MIKLHPPFEPFFRIEEIDSFLFLFFFHFGYPLNFSRKVPESQKKFEAKDEEVKI